MLVPAWTLVVAAIVWLLPVYLVYRFGFGKDEDLEKFEKIWFSFFWPIWAIHACFCWLSRKF